MEGKITLIFDKYSDAIEVFNKLVLKSAFELTNKDFKVKTLKKKSHNHEEKSISFSSSEYEYKRLKL